MLGQISLNCGNIFYIIFSYLGIVYQTILKSSA